MKRSCTAKIHYFGQDGKLIPELAKEQKLTVDKAWIAERALTLEPDEICLTVSYCQASNTIVTKEYEGFTLEFDENNRRIRLKGLSDEFVNPILQIRSTGGGVLDARFFNTVRQETKDTYWQDMIFSACVSYLVNKTTVETDKSSYLALQEGLSVSPAAAIKYIIARLALRANHRVDDYHDSPIDGNDEESAEILNAYQAEYQFLPNMLSVPPEDFDVSIFAETFGADPFQAADIIESIISGDSNIDDIASGYIADRSVNRAAVRNMVEFAVTRMGYSMDEMIGAITRFDPVTDMYLSFQKDGFGKLKIPFPIRNQQETAYAGEVMSYKALSASTALSWHCVLTAMTEPGMNNGRHCAARVLAWTHRVSPQAAQPYQHKIEDAIKALVLSSIEKINDDFERVTATQCADIAVANMLFEARVKQTREFTLPAFFGGMTVIIPEETFHEIQTSKNFRELLESTYGLCDNAVDGCDILRYFVNARVTPHYIIPNRGAKIPEAPFLPLWRDLSDSPALMQKYADILPQPWFKGYGGIYYSMCAALPAKEKPNDEDPLLKSPYSLRVYHRALDAYRKKALEERDHQILTPPSLAEIAQPYFYKKRPEFPCNDGEFHDRWIHSKPRMLTHDDVEARDGVGGNLLEEFKPCVSWLKGFTLDDYMLLPREIAYDIFSACGDRIRAVQYLGDSIRFMDGYTHNFRDSEIDGAKYAVFKTDGGTYVPFLNGKIARSEPHVCG